MLGQLARNKGAPAGHPDRSLLRSRGELLLQPRFRLSGRTLIALHATAARPQLGLKLGLGLSRHRPPPPRKEMRDVCRDGVLLREACRIAAEYNDPAAPVLSLRITEIQTASGMLAGLIGEVLCESGLPPPRMELEFCEESLQTDAADMLYTLAALRDLGVGLVLGGFGSGVSSLTLLRRRSLAGLLTGLKLDALLVQDHSPPEIAGHTEASDGFLHGLTDSAHAIGLMVLAEGVDTEPQAHRLRDIGCDQGLGAWFGEPMPAQGRMPIWPDWLPDRSAGIAP